MFLNSLSKILNLKKNDVVSIVGFGGKTSIMYLIAKENYGKNILITTSTKIYKPKNLKLILGNEGCINYIPQNETIVAGDVYINSKKITALRYLTIKKITAIYDLILIESDGSKGFNIKGWNEEEPVIYDFTKITIGVINLNEINNKVTENNVFRLTEFNKLTNSNVGDLITINTYLEIIIKNNGLFKNSVGKKFLIINQVENLEHYLLAKRLIEIVNKNYFKLDKIVIGSAKQGKWEGIKNE